MAECYTALRSADDKRAYASEESAKTRRALLRLLSSLEGADHDALAE
jgi:hypothetical protein